mmetsp:Transcript_32301/g.60196  ORF Transcript_32301/g.60196 Transcript_32301/m.60196 type:complete len:404 (-) Transcript_32301:126-1337(-)
MLSSFLVLLTLLSLSYFGITARHLLDPDDADDFPKAYHPDLEWTNATLPFLKKVFSQPDYSAFLYYAGLVSKKDLVKPATPLETLCSTIYAQAKSGLDIPPSTHHLPVDVASSDAATQSLTRITDLLLAFNESNRVLVLIGDSISRNSLEALECIINIESGFKGQVETVPPLLQSPKVAFGAIYYEFRFRHSARQNPVTFRLFSMGMWQRLKESNYDWFVSESKMHVFSHEHHAEDVQALFVFNVGLHEDQENYETTLRRVFDHAHRNLLSLGQNPFKNKFLYRETSAQHFNKSAGYYDKSAVSTWKAKNPGKKYTCLPSATTDNAKRDWRHRAEEAAFRPYQNKTQFAFVPFHALTRHYHDMHPFNFRSVKKKRPLDIDCTHFSPKPGMILYRTLWHDLLVH